MKKEVWVPLVNCDEWKGGEMRKGKLDKGNEERKGKEKDKKGEWENV